VRRGGRPGRVRYWPTRRWRCGCEGPATSRSQQWAQAKLPGLHSVSEQRCGGPRSPLAAEFTTARSPRPGRPTRECPPGTATLTTHLSPSRAPARSLQELNRR
jgi:hypothetical protein